MIAVVVVILIIFYILSVIGMWRVFRKAGCMGWLSIIPIANTFVLCKIAWGRYAWAWLFLIPIVNIVIGIITYYRLSKAFGHGAGYTVGLLFLPLIFFILLGFGDEQYLGPGGEDANNYKAPRGEYNNNAFNNQAGGYNNNAYNNQAGGYNNNAYNNQTGAQNTSYSGPQQAGGNMKYCSQCGKLIPVESNFCKYCGAKV